MVHHDSCIREWEKGPSAFGSSEVAAGDSVRDGQLGGQCELT